MTRTTHSTDTINLDALRPEMLDQTDGEVDDSIPELTDADPDVCGIAIVTASGERRSAENAELEFSIQSAVKPFVWALALVDSGQEVIAVGTEPTGEAFDAVLLESDTGRPPNPMVNAGALLTGSLVDGSSPRDRIDRILSGLGAFAGASVRVDDAVNRSEKLFGECNRALGHLMRSFGTLHVGVDDALAVYAAACSVRVTASTLTGDGGHVGVRRPQPGQRGAVVPPEVVTVVLSLMATCGMYDGSGRWIRRVGVPAKSGVAGGLVAAAPRTMGIGVYSPPLDRQGNSVRGMLVCERLSDDIGLHVFGT